MGIRVKPSFHGFPEIPGTYSAVIDDKEDLTQDENGIYRLPYIYDPSGNSPFTVNVGIFS